VKPYISEILEHNGKTHSLPIPAKYRELLDCVHALGIKDEDDEDDLRRIGYRALYVPEPDVLDSRCHVEHTAIELSKLTEAQAKAIGMLCDTFALLFSDVLGILAYLLPHLKEGSDHED
jgi:hypothetical protein